ncbi:MAG: DinB family protein, partial [Chitinophagia bacterium]|nr:DinB family protein [Chitinophagia bacterium]
MELKPMLLKEMAAEAVTTRRMLERVPNDRYDWKPHAKSMTIRELTR